MVSTLVASTRELDLLLYGGGPLHAQTKKTPQHKMGRGDRKRGGNMAGEILPMNFPPLSSLGGTLCMVNCFMAVEFIIYIFIFFKSFAQDSQVVGVDPNAASYSVEEHRP